MKPDVPVIIGYDAVSPLGIDLPTQWERALAGSSGISELTRFEYGPDFPVRIAGEAPDIDHLPYPFLKPREQARWPSPIYKYALLTVQRALERSGLEITPEIARRTAITYSSAVGGLDAVLEADRGLREAHKLPPPVTNPNSCINMVGGMISIMTKATGPIAATITACATGATSLAMGALLLAQNLADVVICGAVDFPLVAPIVAGFATMNGAYQPKTGEPQGPPRAASRPFARHRRGFVVSEGAGCILLARCSFAERNGLAYRTALAGWSMTSDAHHYVAPNPVTVERCIRDSIARADLQPGDVQAVNAHATATRVGDKVEADALNAVFDGEIPPITANKSLFGHAMGASSAIEIIFALEGMAHGCLPPTLNYAEDPDLGLASVVDQQQRLDQTHVLKNAFGFGGCNTCILFRRLK
ncbi:MAG: beta-ketoacyl-[acyl-carrier-protein] synthase family protein [Desulfosarcinaceae bacterium]|nr:beta-ketoacyl-[acyl-carrier-protein] synthase family protein [Desulfosarcinaceae bacterium]